MFGFLSSLGQSGSADMTIFLQTPSGFFIEKRDGTKIGTMFHWLNGNLLEIGYALLPAERGKGYCTEATQLVLDYLFLSKDIPRIQAATHVGNAASRKVLEKAGFKREGILRKATRSRGEWADLVIYSILRDEWEQPKYSQKPLEESCFSILQESHT